MRFSSNYHMIQTLASEGHEIGVETISLQQGLQDKGYEEWVGEMIGMREILRHFSNVTTNDIVGMRAPFLKPGRNTQYKVKKSFNFKRKIKFTYLIIVYRSLKILVSSMIVQLLFQHQYYQYGHIH